MGLCSRCMEIVVLLDVSPPLPPGYNRLTTSFLRLPAATPPAPPRPAVGLALAARDVVVVVADITVFRLLVSIESPTVFSVRSPSPSAMIRRVMCGHGQRTPRDALV
eukprot:GFYU01051025.1.p2 GENE.GFYU01051025.1~~GFYU01051025.1.p2  ORF type:complete len:107 (+),score=14.98 GFYU01051025.1:1-321(+)